MSEYNHVKYSLPRINVLSDEMTNRLLKRGGFREGGGGGLRVFGIPPLAVCLKKFRKFKIYFGWIHLERIALSFARWNSPP